MIKPILIAAAASLAAPAAFAGGFYINTEANSSFTGADYSATTTDIHIGYEGGTDTFDYYVQGGPAIVATGGANIAATEKLDFYGELAVITADDSDDDKSWATKLGAKYSF